MKCSVRKDSDFENVIRSWPNFSQQEGNIDVTQTATLYCHQRESKERKWILIYREGRINANRMIIHSKHPRVKIHNGFPVWIFQKKTIISQWAMSRMVTQSKWTLVRVKRLHFVWDHQPWGFSSWIEWWVIKEISDKFTQKVIIPNVPMDQNHPNLHLFTAKRHEKYSARGTKWYAVHALL